MHVILCMCIRTHAHMYMHVSVHVCARVCMHKCIQIHRNILEKTLVNQLQFYLHITCGYVRRSEAEYYNIDCLIQTKQPLHHHINLPVYGSRPSREDRMFGNLPRSAGDRDLTMTERTYCEIRQCRLLVFHFTAYRSTESEKRKQSSTIQLIMHFLTISVLQACCAVTTEYGIPSDFVRKSTASLQIKISTAQLNFSYRNVIIFWK